MQLSGITPGGSLPFTFPSVNSHLQAGELLVRLICVGRVTLPSSELDTGAGAGAERTGGGGIIFFLPGFSFLSISGAGREKDVAVSH